MNTRNSDDKSEVESLYKTAIENLNKLKSSTQNTLHTSIPLKFSEFKSETARFSLNESEISDNSKTFMLDSSNSEDIITQHIASNCRKLINFGRDFNMSNL